MTNERRGMYVGAATILFSMMVACGGSQASQPPPTAAQPPAQAQPSGWLAIGHVKMLENGKPGIVLHPDGVVEYSKDGCLARIGTLHGDGRFVGEDGAVKARLSETGEVTGADGKPLPLKVAADGTVTMENRTIRVRDDGTLEGANPDAPMMTMEGATAETKRAAMFLLVLATWAEPVAPTKIDVTEEPTPQPAEPPKPTP